MTKELGNKLRLLRIERGLTMLQLQSRSGVSTQTICYIEAGNREPTGKTLNKLAQGLGVPVHELVILMH